MRVEMDRFTRKGSGLTGFGNKNAGNGFPKQAGEAIPDNALAWLELASTAANAAERRYCLRHVLEIAPNQPDALHALAALDNGQPSPNSNVTAMKAARPAAVRSIGALMNAIPMEGAALLPATAAVTPSPALSPAGGKIADAVAPVGAEGQPPDDVALEPPLTADDVLAIADHRQRAVPLRSSASAGDRRMLALLIIGLLCVVLLIGVAGRHNARSRAEQLGLAGILTPRETAAAGGTSAGALTGAGTAFLDGRAAGTHGTQEVITLWPEPFDRSGGIACTLPHASAVLLLDARTAPDGSRALQVKHRECMGWVAAEVVTTEHVEGLDPIAPPGTPGSPPK